MGLSQLIHIKYIYWCLNIKGAPQTLAIIIIIQKLKYNFSYFGYVIKDPNIW